MVVSCNSGGNWSTRRKPQTCRKSLTLSNNKDRPYKIVIIAWMSIKKREINVISLRTNPLTN
jgi:hypothetical protein